MLFHSKEQKRCCGEDTEMSVNPRARGFIKVDSPSAALPAGR
jgi:hypothetical protein